MHKTSRLESHRLLVRVFTMVKRKQTHSSLEIKALNDVDFSNMTINDIEESIQRLKAEYA